MVMKHTVRTEKEYVIREYVTPEVAADLCDIDLSMIKQMIEKQILLPARRGGKGRGLAHGIDARQLLGLASVGALIDTIGVGYSFVTKLLAWYESKSDQEIINECEHNGKDTGEPACWMETNFIPTEETLAVAKEMTLRQRAVEGIVLEMLKLQMAREQAAKSVSTQGQVVESVSESK